MTAIELQQHIFTTIKSNIPEHVSAPEEMAKLLDVSVDSIYRRIRGEKVITLDELQLLCTHYKISLDQLMDIQTDGFLFQGNLLNSETFRYEAYVKRTMNNLAYFSSFKKKELYFLSKDLHLFHHYYSRELAAFKYFFWMSTLIYFPEFKNRKVNFEEYPENLYEMGQQTVRFYNRMDSHEIWTFESLNSTLRQIDYYVECKMFRSHADALKVYEAVEKAIDHLELQARLGYKFDYDDPDKKPLGKFSMYFNEMILADNSNLVIMDDVKMVLILHTAVNYMATRDIAFCDNFYRYTQNLIRRSTLISEVSEKERSRFFRLMRQKVNGRKLRLRL